MRIYPRFLAQFFAWLGGYFWLPCPLCKEPFAGFETTVSSAVVVEEADGQHMYCTCPKPACTAEGQRQMAEQRQKLVATWHGSSAWPQLDQEQDK